MRKIITVSREFGSGGREIAKRLADELNLQYIDNEIVTRLAKETNLNESFISERLERGISDIPVSFAHSFGYVPQTTGYVTLLAKQHKIIKDIAKDADCVIVGRGAEAILSEFKPYKIFVYADLNSKIERCKSRMTPEENLSDKEIKRKIISIDRARKSTHDLYADYKWGDKVGYNICVNTTGVSIKEIVPSIAEMVKSYFGDDEK